MSFARNWRRLALAVFTGAALAILSAAAPLGIGGVAQAQVSGEFQAALQPYGAWRRHPRWGQVWVPAQRPRGWRPYTHGHWVYTEAWGWYWLSDRDEEDWGWVAYHYGRWVFDRGIGWVWVSGDEWAPAWVNWRRGDDLIGWAPLPPDAAIDDTDAEPAVWIFVQPRNLIAPQLRGFILPLARNAALVRNTVLVNRTVPEQGRAAVNAGIAPAIVGAAARTAIHAYRVHPRVIEGTHGVSGAVAVRPQDLTRRVKPGVSRFGVTAQRTATAIAPAASVPKPEPLGKGARGHVGTQNAPPQVKPAPSAAKPKPEPAIKPQARPIVAPSAGDEPPQAKPYRAILPQTPPPAAPKAGTRIAPPPMTRPAPPPRPMQPVNRPVAPPTPAVIAPVVAKPAVPKPTVPKPTVHKPVVSKPAVHKPATANQATAKPAVRKPTALKPPPRKLLKPGENPNKRP